MALPGPLLYPGPGVYPTLASDTATGDYAPLLTPRIDMKPVPRVEIRFTLLDARTRYVNVYRQARGRQMAVPGGLNLAVAGGVGLIDTEAPSGIPLLYLAQQFDEDGVFIGNTGLAQTTLRSPYSTIHNPFDPQGGIAVRIGADTGVQVEGGGTATVYYPTRRSAGVAITGQRYGIPNAPVYVWTDRLETADRLDAMFGDVNGDLGLPPILCIRFSAKLTSRIRLPQPLFLAVPRPVQKPVNLLAGGQRIGWDLSGPEIDRPAAALAQALLTRGDLDAAYPTRAARDAAYPTRLAADTDYNLAGRSGTPGGGTTLPDPGTGGGTGGGTATDNGDGTGSISGSSNDDGTGTFG